MQEADIEKIPSFGSEHFKSLLYKLKHFWKAVLHIIQSMFNINSKTGQEILTRCIGYNRQIGTENYSL